MTILQVKDYLYSLGMTASKLHDLEYTLYKLGGHRDKQEKYLKELHDFVDNNQEAQDQIIKFSDDKRTDIRQVSAAIVNYLWKYWKHVSWDFTDDADYRKYDQAMKTYADKLSWTLPLIEKFLQDRTPNPIIISLYNIWEFDYVPTSYITRLRNAAVELTDTKSIEIKKALISTLADYYEDSEEARRILDDQALQFYIDATYDPHEKVRDWAFFELWTSVENLNTAASQAFIAGFDRESPRSEAHVEAAIGMARMGLEYERLVPVILENLAKDGCGTGWIDAAEEVHTADVLLAVKALYKRIISFDQNDDRLDKLEWLLRDWND